MVSGKFPGMPPALYKRHVLENEFAWAGKELQQVCLVRHLQ